jgi:hypothetical protein
MARNTAKHPPVDGRTRRQRIEEQRALERKAERRRNILIVGTASVVAIALVLGVVFTIRVTENNKPENKAAADFGVAASAASCDPEVSKAATGNQVHVGPGTDTPNETSVKYDTVPPMFGPHFVVPDESGRKFFTDRDSPKVETLVHNLEHGYTVVWYDKTVTGDQLQALQDLSTNLSTNDTPKFIAAYWDGSHGEFPAGKHIAMSHWGATNGFSQLCGQVSGEAIQNFVEKHPYTDSPEPNGA